MNRRSVLKLATTSLILAAPAIKASTGVFRPATTGNRYVVHVYTRETALISPRAPINPILSKTGHYHQVLLFDKQTHERSVIDDFYTGLKVSKYAIGEKLGAVVEDYTDISGSTTSQFYPGATFDRHGNASYEDGRYYPKLIKMLPEPGEHTIKIPRLSA